MKSFNIMQLIVHLQKIKNKNMSLMVCLDKISGVFEPKSLSKDPLISDIYSSVKNLNYINNRQDRINMRSDVLKIEKDFKKATKEAKQLLNYD